MFNAISTALSALQATSAAVNVVGNNLANLNTNGFKADTFAFHDMVSQQINSPGTDVGSGVSALQTIRQFTQGSIQQTTGTLDAAISGEGFFIVKNQQNLNVYTRAGNFTVDSTGNLLTSTGEFVQGWNAVDGVLNANGAVGNIVLPLKGVTAAVPTSRISMTVNLDTRAAVDSPGGTYSTPIQVVDSQGGVHTLTATFTKTDVNTWRYDVTIPESDLAVPAAEPLATGTLQFDFAGKLVSPAVTDEPVAVPVTGLANGAADMELAWDLFKSESGLLSQYAETSSVSATSQNGTQAGQIIKVGIADGGVIVAHYSNGQQATIAQLAVASIQNPQTMVSIGNNNLQTTIGTAAPAVGTAGSGGRGQIKGQSLEASTVDIAREFTNLITLQRSYQADSRVITTSDEMLQELISLKR